MGSLSNHEIYDASIILTISFVNDQKRRREHLPLGVQHSKMRKRHFLRGAKLEGSVSRRQGETRKTTSSTSPRAPFFVDRDP